MVRAVRLHRDDVYDAAYCIFAIQRRARRLHNFDTFDHARRDVLYSGKTQGARVDPYAIDQYQRVVAVCTAGEYGYLLPRPAGPDDVHAALEAQQFRKFRRHAAFYRVSVDNVDRCDDALNR